MKIISMLLIISLLVPLTGCGLSLEDPKVVKLEARLTKLEDSVKKLEAANTRLQNEKAALKDEYLSLAKKYNDLVAANRVLIKERDMFKEEAVILKGETVVKSATFVVKLDNNKLYNKPRAAEVGKAVLDFARKNNFNVKLKVEGYATKVGDADYNLWLSKERAEGVFHKIMGMAGADAKRFNHTHVIAYGEESDNERKVVVTVEVLR